MKFTAMGRDIDLDVTSVILEYDPKLADSTSNLILWHCPICNQPLFQYSARLVMIIPGMTPTNVPIITICGKCKHRYMLVSIMGKTEMLK
jgi:C4-type Zn-finger protein